MKKTRSSLFASSDGDVDVISEGFFGVQLSNTDGIYPRTIPNTTSTTWGSQTDVSVLD